MTKECLICHGPALVRAPSRYERTKTCSRLCASRYAAYIQGLHQHELAVWRRIAPKQPVSHRLIPLTQHAVSKVDIEDFDAAMEKNWCLSDTGYARRTSSRMNERLHRFVMERVLGRELSPREQVDHINGDRLDNQRSNLRVVSNAENARNRPAQRNSGSRLKGVTRSDTVSERWTTELQILGTRLRWGGMESAEEAAWMYDQLALALHGDYARLNFEYV